MVLGFALGTTKAETDERTVARSANEVFILTILDVLFLCARLMLQCLQKKREEAFFIHLASGDGQSELNKFFAAPSDRGRSRCFGK